MNETEWRELLAFCDRNQLTLLVGHVCRPALPAWARTRIDRNYVDHSHRFEQLQAATLEIAGALAQRSVEFTLLKGLSHSPAFTPDPRLRPQCDIDLWCLPAQLLNAKSALLDLGYRPIGTSKSRHLAPMVRERAWEWRGDYFARDLPIPVELHYKLWDDELEFVPGPEEDGFWGRRSSLCVGGAVLPVLESADAAAFAAFHVMMHLLHGDLRLQRTWELAYLLHTHAQDEPFWRRWQSRHSEPARRIQTVAFLLADCWFACGLPEVVQEEVEALPRAAIHWMRHYGLSPIESLFAPNKHELWLNLCLVDSFAGRLRVLLRRLLPIGAVKPKLKSESGHESAAARVWVLMKRAAYHVRILPVALWHGCRWWWRAGPLGNRGAYDRKSQSIQSGTAGGRAGL